MGNAQAYVLRQPLEICQIWIKTFEKGRFPWRQAL